MSPPEISRLKYSEMATPPKLLFPTAAHQRTSMPIALILVRWLHLSASILLASLFLFEAAIVLPAAKKPSAGSGHLLNTIHRLTCRTAFWTLLVTLMSRGFQ